MFKVEDTGYSRKLDEVGRIGIPKKLRDEYSLDTQDAYTWHVIATPEGNFLGLPINEGRTIQAEKELYEQLKKKFERA